MRYPCTGHVGAEGFGAFLEAELGEPRRNLRAFARELSALFDAPHVTLTSSGSAANLAAALTLRERARNLRAVVSAFTFPTTVVALETAGFEVSVVDVELSQGDRTAVHAVVNLGEPEHFPPDGAVRPLLSANPVLDLMAPEPPDDIEPIGPGHPLAGLVRSGDAVHPDIARELLRRVLRGGGGGFDVHAFSVSSRTLVARRSSMAA